MIVNYIGQTQESEEWQRGFEVGILYALMCSRHQSIVGTYWKTNQDSIFAMAKAMGYSFEWNTIDNNRSAIRFVLPMDTQTEDQDGEESQA